MAALHADGLTRQMGLMEEHADLTRITMAEEMARMRALQAQALGVQPEVAVVSPYTCYSAADLRAGVVPPAFTSASPVEPQAVAHANAQQRPATAPRLIF